METLNNYFVIVGVIAVGVGIYVLITKKLVGRNVGKATRETVLKFVPIEAATYIVEGLLMILMGLPQYFPVLGNNAAVFTLIGLGLAVIIANVVLANKFFPDARAGSSNQGRRLK